MANDPGIFDLNTSLVDDDMWEAGEYILIGIVIFHMRYCPLNELIN